MDNKGFEMQNDPGAKNGEVVLDANSLQNGYNNGRVSPTSDPEVAAARARGDKAKQRRDRDPLRFIRWISNRTGLWFGLTLAGHIFFLLLTAILSRVGYDILPITFDRVPLNIRSSPEYLRGLAWDYRNEDENDVIDRGSREDAMQNQQTIQYDFVGLLFDDSDGNVFTKANLEAINKTEEEFMAVKDMAKFCLREKGTTQCSKPESVLRFFDGTYAALYPTLYDPTFERIPEVLYEASTKDEFKQRMRRFLDKDATITATEAVSIRTQSILSFGWPLEGFTNTTDKEDDQTKKFDTFFRKNFMPEGDSKFKDGVGDMTFSYGGGTIIGLWISRQVVFDLALAIGSFVFIGVFMAIQTTSIWITGWTIFSIITGFCGANLVYRIVLDFRYVGVFHVLAVFIVLGIGADDVFVFVDTWKETAHHSYKSLAHRMSDCYRKAALAMLFTSITTAIAFFVSASSPFLGIYSFGVFSGVLIIVNYCSVITFLPCVVLMYHKHFERFKCCCCCPRAGWTGDASTPAHGESRTNPVVRFFAGPYFKFVTNSIARWFIVLFFVGLLAGFIYSASRLKVNEEQIKFVGSNVPIGKFIEDINKYQSSVESNAQVYIVFGLRQQDLDSCHHTDATCTGKTVWDPNFNMRTLEIQNAFKNFCDEMLTLKNDSETVTKLKIKVTDSVPEVRCFAVDLDNWLQGRSLTPPPSGPLKYPVTETVAKDLMRSRPDVYNVQTLPAGFASWIETGTSYWLYNGFAGLDDQFRQYNLLIGEMKNATTTVNKTIAAGPVSFEYYYGTDFRYLAIVVNTTLEPRTLGFPTGIPIMKDWNQFIEDKKQTLPPALQGMFQCTPEESIGFDLWHWLLVQEKLVNSAFIGIVIGICTALPILIIATHNLITGTYATITIVMIVTMVLGVIPMAGWKLGLLESVNLVLLVGLSVDYVVHLAEGYSRSQRPDRHGRVQDMLREVGISVLSGAVTTLGASIFLLAAKILFFVQFGLFMFCTIGFSILFALGLFVTVMGIIGPQGDTGDLYALFRKCCGKKSQE